MKLYHYTRSDIAIKKILPEMELRMNFLANMNDPKENLCHIVNSHEYFDFHTNSNKLDSNKILLADRIRKETRIIAFSKDKEVLCESYRVSTQGYQFQRMWANYGQNHEGICIEIDYDKFVKENIHRIKRHKIINQKVKYNNFLYQGLPTRLLGMSPENNLKQSNSKKSFWEELQGDKNFIDDRFFTKNLDWDGESEYRFLTFSNDPNDIFLSIKESLTKVIFGINFSKHFLPSLMKSVPKELIYGVDFSQEGNLEIRSIVTGEVSYS
jgi:hypothetical protein